MIAIKIILIVLQFSLFVICTLRCIKNESKVLWFFAVSFLLFAILNFFRLVDLVLVRC